MYQKNKWGSGCRKLLFLPPKYRRATTDKTAIRSTIHRPSPGDGTRPPIQPKSTVAGVSLVIRLMRNLMVPLLIRRPSVHWGRRVASTHGARIGATIPRGEILLLQCPFPTTGKHVVSVFMQQPSIPCCLGPPRAQIFGAIGWRSVAKAVHVRLRLVLRRS